MKRYTRTLATALLSTACLTLAGAPSFALDLPQAQKYEMGPLGDWYLSGGVSGNIAGWNHNSPCAGAPGSQCAGSVATPGAGSLNGDVSINNAIAILNSKGNMFGSVPLQMHAWVGIPPNTPVMGYTSPNVSPNLHALGSDANGFGHTSPLFKGWATYQPLDVFSVEAGRLPSPDGTEIGVGFLNPTVFLSDLNNMQTTVADGVQVNFISGADKSFYYGFLPGYGSTLTVRLADGYKTGHPNELGFTGLWNLNPDGSSAIVAFGHTRLGTVGSVADNTSSGTGRVAGFGTVNAKLAGIGAFYNVGALMISPEVEYQWLSKSDIPSSVRLATGQDYYNVATQVTFSYDFGLVNMFGEPIRLGFAVQPSYIYQHGDSADPNRQALGNFLGLNTGAGDPVGGFTLGTFGAGSRMFGIQANPTFQFHNFFVRPAVAYTRLASIEPGFGYGATGNSHDQFVGLLEVGFLFGQQMDTDTGQHP